MTETMRELGELIVNNMNRYLNAIQKVEADIQGDTVTTMMLVCQYATPQEYSSKSVPIQTAQRAVAVSRSPMQAYDTIEEWSARQVASGRTIKTRDLGSLIKVAQQKFEEASFQSDEGLTHEVFADLYDKRADLAKIYTALFEKEKPFYMTNEWMRGCDY